jgi:hypothetical protein
MISLLSFLEIGSFNRFTASLKTPGEVIERASSTLPVVHPVMTNETASVTSVERSNNATKDATKDEIASSSTLPVVHPVRTNETARVSSLDRSKKEAKNETEINVQKKDWFQRKRFQSSRALKKSCHIFENVCHSSGRWWYKPTKGAEQPDFTLLTNLRGAKGYPEKVRVFHSDVNAHMRNRTCHESPIPNHVSLHGNFDTMLGEFYVRVLVGLNEMARSQVDNMDDFLEQTQLYLHMYEKNNKAMLDSHHIFTDAFRGHPLLDFKSLLDNAECQCLPRLLLCGYRRNKEKAAKLGGGKVIEPGNGIFPWGTNYKYNVYDDLRKRIRRRVLENPLARDDIKAYKEQVLRDKGVTADFDDWKLIGLAQRSGRRRWLNLQENENACDQALRRHKILCTEINVEIKESYPYRQAISHGALDGLFGIHGAQLTEAIWMKRGSLVVEFLPWMHKGTTKIGGWTRNVGAPTPLGKIYSGTDLNHIGYPLQRHSAPYCYGVETKDEGRCWRGKAWDVRDFKATSESIIDSVSMFFVNQTISCENYRDWAADSFVLYNIQCGNDARRNYIWPHHFYWKTELNKLPKYTEYSNDANFTG